MFRENRGREETEKKRKGEKGRLEEEEEEEEEDLMNFSRLLPFEYR